MATAFQVDTFQNDAFQTAAGGTSYVETCSATLGWITTGAEVQAGIDTGTVVMGLITTGADKMTVTETGAAVLGWVTTGTDAFSGYDAGAAVLDWITTGAEVYTPAGGAVVTGGIGAPDYRYMAQARDKQRRQREEAELMILGVLD